MSRSAMIFAPSIEAARRSLDYALDQARAMGGGEDVVEVCFQRYVDESVRAQLAWDVFVGLVRGWEFCAVSPGDDEVVASEALRAREEADVPKLERAKLRIAKLEAELAKSRGDGSLAEVRAEQERIRGELDGLRRRGPSDPRSPKIVARVEGMAAAVDARLAPVEGRPPERVAVEREKPPRRTSVRGEPNLYEYTAADGGRGYEVTFRDEDGRRRWRRVGSDLERAKAIRDELHAVAS